MILNEVFKTMSTTRALEVLIYCHEDGLKGMGVVRGIHMILNEVFKTMSTTRALEVLIDCY